MNSVPYDNLRDNINKLNIILDYLEETFPRSLLNEMRFDNHDIHFHKDKFSFEIDSYMYYEDESYTVEINDIDTDDREEFSGLGLMFYKTIKLHDLNIELWLPFKEVCIMELDLFASKYKLKIEDLGFNWLERLDNDSRECVTNYIKENFKYIKNINSIPSFIKDLILFE